MHKVSYAMQFLLVILTGLCLGILISLMPAEALEPEVQVVERVVFSVDENALLFKFIEDGRESVVYDFYDQYTGDRRLTYLIVSNALSRGIPVNYFMALAYTESRFTPNAKGVNRTPEGVVRSTDYGLFQLNSVTYKDYAPEFLLNVDNNVRMAADHLYRNYVKYGTWYEAIFSYNAGNTDLLRNGTVRHFISVVTWHRELTDKFVEVVMNDS